MDGIGASGRVERDGGVGTVIGVNGIRRIYMYMFVYYVEVYMFVV